MSLFRLIPFLAILLLPPASTQAREIRLKADGTGEFPTIAAAIRATSTGDTITLAAGTYRGTGNQDLDVPDNAVILRTEPAHPESCVIDCGGSGRAIHLHPRESGTRIIGLTMQGGQADMGGAALVDGTGAVRFERCVFHQNNAGRGGAVAATTQGAHFNECWFIGNRATERAGAAYLWSASEVEFSNCCFVDNTAPEGSGASCVGCSETKVTHSLIAFNGPGEGIQCGQICGVRVESSDIYGNAGGDWKGGLDSLRTKSGNISEDPRFIAPRAPDYRFAPDSPCRTKDRAIGAPER